ncbi:MAG TPA: SIR2 family protein [Candidatus Angelobacter sp.]|nr:SIR2 family protein [Candidatus Angelobacter sp.]
MASKSDPRSEDVSQLHSAYKNGRLNIFVGAGVSQQSGFPGWDDLNKGLLLQYLNAQIGNSTPAAMLASERIAEKAGILYDVLGRDAVADFVEQGMRDRFGPVLAQSTYKGRKLEDLPLKSIHRQIVALSDHARLFTLNFDPLLELALAQRFPGREWTSFRSPNGNRRLAARNQVEHVHGWLDPDGRMSWELILTQSSYFELSANSKAFANRALQKMLSDNSVTAILGMSLADPNFRRFLYFLNKKKTAAHKRIYVVMKRENAVVDHYMQTHWGNNGLQIIFIEQYEEIPSLLRDIQWGETPKRSIPKWTNEAIRWRSETLRDSVIFTDAWQKIGHESLRALVTKVKTLFGVPPHESLTATLFIPFSESKTEARIRIVASSREAVDHNKALDRALGRVLSIAKGEEQGIAGVCFSTGTERAIAFGEGQVDVNFSNTMMEKWTGKDGYRDWRSIVAVPVIDSKYWVPVAVITLTSNFANPFWTSFGEKQQLLQSELYAAMRQAGHFALVGFAASIEE